MTAPVTEFGTPTVSTTGKVQVFPLASTVVVCVQSGDVASATEGIVVVAPLTVLERLISALACVETDAVRRALDAFDGALLPGMWMTTFARTLPAGRGPELVGVVAPGDDDDGGRPVPVGLPPEQDASAVADSNATIAAVIRKGDALLK